MTLLKKYWQLLLGFVIGVVGLLLFTRKRKPAKEENTAEDLLKETLENTEDLLKQTLDNKDIMKASEDYQEQLEQITEQYVEEVKKTKEIKENILNTSTDQRVKELAEEYDLEIK